MMMERHRNLNQSLQKFLIGLGSRAPYVLQNLMRLKEITLIKEADALQQVA